MKSVVGPALALWLSLSTCSVLGCQARDPTPAGRGARIFQRTCAGCHGSDGRGTDRPGLAKPARDLTKGDFQAQVTNQQLRQSIRVGKGQMPSFAGLMGEDDIADVIAFIRTLAPPGTLLPPGSVAAPPGPVSAAGAAGSAATSATPPSAGTAAVSAEPSVASVPSKREPTGAAPP